MLFEETVGRDDFAQCCFDQWLSLGIRIEGFRALGFRALGFRGLGFRALGFRV